MKHRVASSLRGDCLSPTEPRFLGNPLDFIAEDHWREREICAQLDRIADADNPDDADVTTVLEFLREELPLHLRDEEEDLFPLMRRRCAAEDEIEKVIGRLLSDHGHAAADTPAILATLNGLAGGGCEFDDAARDALRAFSSHGRRHLILENAIILPIARARLTEGDLDTLRLRMLQRRDLDRLFLEGE